jgi:hypothetical protein
MSLILSLLKRTTDLMPERKRAILARNGFQTYATTRNLAKSENIKSVASKENLPLPPLDEPESLEFSSSLVYLHQNRSKL